VLGVGGDFFLFHPLRLLSGGYITGEDLMHDRVVLDEELAWKLFGGSDVAGLTVTISDKPYLVAGVVRREEDFADRRAYTAGAGFFMAFDALSAAAGTGIGCYETRLRKPRHRLCRRHRGRELLPGRDGGEQPPFQGGEHLRRHRRLRRALHEHGGVVFPHWENAARLLEDYLALLLLLSCCSACSRLPARARRWLSVCGAYAPWTGAMPALRDRMEERA
jgi:hypothetical protein